MDTITLELLNEFALGAIIIMQGAAILALWRDSRRSRAMLVNYLAWFAGAPPVDIEGGLPGGKPHEQPTPIERSLSADIASVKPDFELSEAAQARNKNRLDTIDQQFTFPTS